MVRSKINIQRIASAVVVDSEVVKEIQFDLAVMDENGNQVVMGIILSQYDKPDYSNKHVLSC
jgi:hypothetical protein